MINNQFSHTKTEYDETPGAEYSNGNNSEDTETNKTSAVVNFMRKIPDNEITKSILLKFKANESLECGPYVG